MARSITKRSAPEEKREGDLGKGKTRSIGKSAGPHGDTGSSLDRFSGGNKSGAGKKSVDYATHSTGNKK